jgi:hypothetical protein
LDRGLDGRNKVVKQREIETTEEQRKAGKVTRRRKENKE